MRLGLQKIRQRNSLILRKKIAAAISGLAVATGRELTTPENISINSLRNWQVCCSPGK